MYVLLGHTHHPKLSEEFLRLRHLWQRCDRDVTLPIWRAQNPGNKWKSRTWYSQCLIYFTRRLSFIIFLERGASRQIERLVYSIKKRHQLCGLSLAKLHMIDFSWEAATANRHGEFMLKPWHPRFNQKISVQNGRGPALLCRVVPISRRMEAFIKGLWSGFLQSTGRPRGLLVPIYDQLLVSNRFV